MRDALFTRMEWDLLDYALSQEQYNREHGIVSPRTSPDDSPAESVPLSSLRKVYVDIQEGYVRERRAGKYLERRITTVQQTCGSLIRKLPHEHLWEGEEVQKPYVLRRDLIAGDRLTDSDVSSGHIVCVDEDENLFCDDRCIKFMKTNSSRFANPRQVRKSCENFKWLIRANEDKIRLFVTLTYARNMTDTKQLYQDFRSFWQRLKREVSHLKGYLVAFEPQKRGAWHAHVLLLSDFRMLYISNKVMRRVWGHGFTKTQRPKGIRDVASYLTSYLTNVKSGTTTKKGERLGMYPLGFHFLRRSKLGVRQTSVRRWYGPFNRLSRTDDWKLLYDYQNVSRISRDGDVFQVSKILCLEDTSGLIFNGHGYDSPPA